MAYDPDCALTAKDALQMIAYRKFRKFSHEDRDAYAGVENDDAMISDPTTEEDYTILLDGETIHLDRTHPDGEVEFYIFVLGAAS